MLRAVSILLRSIATWFRSRLSLQMELIALRHQVAVYEESVARPKLQPTNRLFWVWLSRLWPGWESPRIVGELRKLGMMVSKSTVEKYRPRIRKPPSPAWTAFLSNHVKALVSCDFFTVPTATFNVLFVFIILAHN